MIIVAFTGLHNEKIINVTDEINYVVNYVVNLELKKIHKFTMQNYEKKIQPRHTQWNTTFIFVKVLNNL